MLLSMIHQGMESFQLFASQIEIFRSAETLRSDITNYLRDTEIMVGVPIELFAGVPMEQYLCISIIIIANNT